MKINENKWKKDKKEENEMLAAKLPRLETVEVVVDFEKKLEEIIKSEISKLNKDEEFVVKIEVVTDGKDKSGID